MPSEHTEELIDTHPASDRHMKIRFRDSNHPDRVNIVAPQKRAAQPRPQSRPCLPAEIRLISLLRINANCTFGSTLVITPMGTNSGSSIASRRTSLDPRSQAPANLLARLLSIRFSCYHLVSVDRHNSVRRSRCETVLSGCEAHSVERSFCHSKPLFNDS